MKKGIKIALTVCLILAVLGAGLVAAGFMMGGSLNFRLDWRTHAISTADTAEARGDLTPEPFTTLQIEVATADITVERGDGWSLSYALSEEPEITQENGLLKLKVEERSGVNFVGISFSADNAPFIKITVPADAALEEITLATATGEVTLADLEAERIELACATGDISLNGVTAQTLLLAGNTGDLTLQDVTAAEQAKLTTNTGEIRAALTAPGGVTAESNTGDVTLTLTGTAADFGLSLESDTGDVTVDGRDEGHSYQSSGGAAVRAESSTGDVTVRFG